MSGLLVGLLASCADSGRVTPDDEVDGPPVEPGRIPTEDAVPKVEPKSRYGNPASYVVLGKRYYTRPTSRGFVERGIASWYGSKFHGRRTSSGETYDMYAMTAAHKEVPLPTYARVTHLGTGKSIVVKINDRGPFHANRVIDLSYGAASRLGILKAGTAPVEVRAIDPRVPLQSQTSRTREDLVSSPSRAGAPAARSPRTAPAPNGSALGVPGRQVAMYLQLGAFASAENARRLAQRANGVNAITQVSPAQAQGVTLYRVRVGPFSSAAEVDAMANRLSQIGVHDTVVIVEQGNES